MFAKDVFEHLTEPAAALDEVLAHASDRAVLALDLDDKGAVVYQHVSPQLAPSGIVSRRPAFCWLNGQATSRSSGGPDE